MSSKKKVWDFECPQFVDFERELDSSGKDDVFFDCKDKSPENESLCKTPANQGNGKGLTDSDENRLLDKMTAALSILENTPKIKKSASRGKLFSENLAKSTISKKTKSSAIKLRTALVAPRKSRSLTQLNRIISGKTNKARECGMHRSSSLNDLGTHKKYKYPVTPMCLKRTIVKAKEKVLKSTEEMELEQIARLQKQLIQHLRQNEISLKRLKLRPRQCPVLKVPTKCDGVEEAKGSNQLAEKSNVPEKESRRTIHTLTAAAVKKEAAKLDAIINNEKMDNTIYSKKPKSLSVSIVDSNLNKSTAKGTKKQTYNRILDHSGLIFLPSVKSNAVVKPFIFEAKVKETKPQIAGVKQKEKSTLNLKDMNDKENIPSIKLQSAMKKCQVTQNDKCNTNKWVESNNLTGKRMTSAQKGVPLSENMTRH